MHPKYFPFGNLITVPDQLHQMLSAGVLTRLLPLGVCSGDLKKDFTEITGICSRDPACRAG